MIKTHIRKITAEELQHEANTYRLQCRQTFSTSSGRSVLNHLKKIYCDGNLYGQDDRSTAYLIGQRDLILELSSLLDERET